MGEFFNEKYRYVAENTKNISGRLLDIGARDRVLNSFLQQDTLRYFSADIVPGHDYQFNLEKAIPFANDEFDIVVALDVLEHLEHPHDALRELIRITKKNLFVSLPNMASLSNRLNFLIKGNLSNKYALLPEYQVDRHRWLPTYDQSQLFVNSIVDQSGCTVIQHNIYEENAIYGKFRFLIPTSLFYPKLRTYTMIFKITKP